jgi:DNA-binding transcriptional LysR family regulator
MIEKVPLSSNAMSNRLQSNTTSNWDDYRIFVAAARAGSFTVAAQQLHLQTSSVSRAIARLERTCGIRLFVRNTRRITLTDTGKSLYGRLTPLFDQMEQVVQGVADDEGGVRGILRVIAPFEFGLAHLTGVVSAMLATHPHLEIELELSTRLVNPVSEGVDVVFSVYQGQPPDSSLAGRRIETLPMGVFASPSLVKQLGQPYTPEDLNNWPCMEMLNEKRWNFTGPDGAQHEVDPRGRFRCSPAGMRIGPVIAGLGATVAPISFQAQYVAGGQLVQLLTDYELAPLQVYAFFQSQFMHAKTRLFIDQVVSSLQPNPSFSMQHMGLP